MGSADGGTVVSKNSCTVGNGTKENMEQMMKRKIVFYISSLGKGGAERVVVNLAADFRDAGYEVVIVTTFRQKSEYDEPEQVKRYVLEDLNRVVSGSRVKYFITRCKNIRKIWKAERPDVIISFLGKTNMMALLTSIGLRIPVFVSVRSDPNREYASKMMRLVSKTLFRKAKGIIVQTEDAKAYFPKGMQKKVRILPNSLDRRFIQPRYEGTRTQEIVTVGRLDANKNHQMLFRAFAHVHEEYPELKLVIYGGGFEESDTTPMLKKLAEELGIADKVMWMGRRSDIPDCIYRSRIFVLMSQYEGMPNALLEAMSLGLAVISTDCPCGGPRTVIRDGENGLLVPVDDIDALEQALRRILENPQLEEMFGRNASKLGMELAPEKVNQMWREYIEQGM